MLYHIEFWHLFCQRLLRPADIIFLKMVEETQNSIPPKATRHHKSKKILILLPLKADLLCTLHYETPCSLNFASCTCTIVECSQLRI